MAENGKSDADLDLLLPWYVNGSLKGEEREAVEAYLAQSAEARDEVALLTALRQQVKDEKIENSPGDLGLQRLKRDISRRDEQDQVPAETGKVISIASWWRPLAVAACLAIVVQAGVMVNLAGGPDDGVTIAEFAGAPDLQVTFAPTATEQEIREVLQSAGTVIVDGPSALGIYGLRLADPEGDNAAVEAALVKLQARGDVVTFAEKKD